MSAVVTERHTLDINFHIVDGTAVGDSFTWKFNDPDQNIGSLSTVRDALGGQSGFLTDWFRHPADASTYDMYICDAQGHEIDNVDGAKKVSTVTSKEDLG